MNGLHAEVRDTKGRFAKDNKRRPGNPFLRRIGELRRTVLNFALQDDMEHAALVLKELAMDGDLAAIKLLFQYLLGPPMETVESDGLDVEEEPREQKPSRPSCPPNQRLHDQPLPIQWPCTPERAIVRKQTVEKPPSRKRRNGTPCLTGPILRCSWPPTPTSNRPSGQTGSSRPEAKRLNRWPSPPAIGSNDLVCQVHEGKRPRPPPSRNGRKEASDSLRPAATLIGMGYPNLRACLADLERTRQLVRIEQEIDPYLEAAEIHRRVYQARGPAIYYARVKGCRFPMVSNLFGTLDRARFLFRDTLEAVRRLVELRVDPSAFWKRPWRYRDVPRVLWNTRPKWVGSGPILAGQTTIRELPQLVCWPRDGGAFITLPQVYTEDADQPGWRHSNLGMYRVQLYGNRYQPDREVGLHYQIHRGIGVHHAAALRRGAPFRVHIFVGGPPAMTLAAVMPLPEGLPELAFAGALGGQRVRLIRDDQLSLPIAAEADFCIAGTVDPQRQLPEGPFGDHLGYYSLTHDFPVLNVERVYHRADAVWPFTVVGRPPQEDTTFGQLIHEITGPIIPTVVPGVHAVHAVDAAGVHPLLLAIGSERYVPYAERRKPQELLTCANAILGQGQLSLAKYLFLIAREDAPELDVHDIPAFFRHLLERFDPRHDLHFQTCTTMDTLDYSGAGLNEGSKLVVAAVGPPRRQLPATLPHDVHLPDSFSSPRVCLPGILAVQALPHPHSLPDQPQTEIAPDLRRFCEAFRPNDILNTFPLVVLVDDSAFTAGSLNNWLWVTFTRSNPAADIWGIGAFTHQKHWGCDGSVVIDARIKPHHAPPLEENPEASRRVEALAARGGPLHGLF